ILPRSIGITSYELYFARRSEKVTWKDSSTPIFARSHRLATTNRNGPTASARPPKRRAPRQISRAGCLRFLRARHTAISRLFVEEKFTLNQCSAASGESGTFP